MGRRQKAPKAPDPVAPAPVMQDPSIEQQSEEELNRRTNRKGRLSAFQILGRNDQPFGG